jgi:UDP-hydrolysing UDP-N-acetyl-D-glucosamine 2-epimerase
MNATPSGGERATRVIAVLTTGRQDWGILRSTCVAIRATDGLELRLLAGGMHLSAAHGSTVRLLRDDGFAPNVEIAWIDDPATQAAHQAGAALERIGEDLAAHRPDAIVLAGDRFETAAAALAATLARVPIVHLHGGEQTLGAFDDALRHAITKLSHLHLVSEPEHAARVIALGEDPATVHVVGAPGLDNADRPDLPDRAALAADLGISLEPPVVIVTLHPETLGTGPDGLSDAVITAMDTIPATYVVTLPNSDPDADRIRTRLLDATAGHPRRVAVEALGERRFWGLLRTADAMLGNSSSAIVEAPAVGLPAVNVGDRQRGRHRGSNVIDAAPDGSAVTAALARALDPATRKAALEGRPPLADGRVGERIARIIAAWEPPVPPRKAPIDVTVPRER